MTGACGSGASTSLHEPKDYIQRFTFTEVLSRKFNNLLAELRRTFLPGVLKCLLDAGFIKGPDEQLVPRQVQGENPVHPNIRLQSKPRHLGGVRMPILLTILLMVRTPKGGQTLYRLSSHNSTVRLRPCSFSSAPSRSLSESRNTDQQ